MTERPSRPVPIRLPMLGTPPTGCCPAPAAPAFPYRDWSFTTGTLNTPAGAVPQISPRPTRHDLLGRWQMRWGLGRDRYRVRPGLYAIGTPTAIAPVLVTANYKLTFDTLRAALADLDCWLLVLDTKGINVWCAAGKGTFGTAELLRQVRACTLEQIVSHRTLIVPQLGAVGVAAHEVTKECGFRVVYGPIRATDLPAFLAAGLKATPAMRRVTFTTVERLILTPVELTGFGWKPLGIALLLLLLGGLGPGLFSFAAAAHRGTAAILAGVAGLLAGGVLTPILLPWVPGRAFALKGALVGLTIAGAGALLFADRLGMLNSFALLLALPAVAAYCAMNFTGSSTFTSPSGVEKEMRRALPLQGAALLFAFGLWLAGAF